MSLRIVGCQRRDGRPGGLDDRGIRLGGSLRLAIRNDIPAGTFRSIGVRMGRRISQRMDRQRAGRAAKRQRKKLRTEFSTSLYELYKLSTESVRGPPPDHPLAESNSVSQRGNESVATNVPPTPSIEVFDLEPNPRLPMVDPALAV